MKVKKTIKAKIKEMAENTRDRRIKAKLKKENWSQDKFEPIRDIILRNKKDESVVFVSGEQGSGKTTVAKASYSLRMSKITLVLKFFLKVFSILLIPGVIMTPILISNYVFEWSLLSSILTFAVWSFVSLLCFLLRGFITQFLSKLSDSYVPIDLWSIFKNFEYEKFMDDKGKFKTETDKENFNVYIFSRLWRTILLRVGFIPKAVEHFRLAMEYENVDTKIKHISKSFFFAILIPASFIGLFIGLSFIDGWSPELSWIGGSSSIVIYIASLYVMDIKVSKDMEKIYKEGIGAALIPEILLKKSKNQKIYIHFMDLDRVKIPLIGPIVHEITTLYKSKNVNLIIEFDEASKTELKNYVKKDLKISKLQKQKEYLLKLIGTEVSVKSLSSEGFISILHNKNFGSMDKKVLSSKLYDVAKENFVNSYRYENAIKEGFEKTFSNDNDGSLKKQFDESKFYEGFAKSVIATFIDFPKPKKIVDVPYKNSKNMWDLASNYQLGNLSQAHSRIKFINYKPSEFIGNFDFDVDYVLDLMEQQDSSIDNIWPKITHKDKLFNIPISKIKFTKKVNEFVFKKDTFVKFALRKDDGDTAVKNSEKVIELFNCSPKPFEILLISLDEESRTPILLLLARELKTYSIISDTVMKLFNEFVPSKMISISKMSQSQKDIYISGNSHKVENEGVLQNIFEIKKSNFIDEISSQVSEVNETLFAFMLEHSNQIEKIKFQQNKNMFTNEQYIELFETFDSFKGLKLDRDLTFDLNMQIIVYNDLFDQIDNIMVWYEPTPKPSEDQISRILNKSIGGNLWNEVVSIVNKYPGLISKLATIEINEKMPIDFINKIASKSIIWDKGYEYLSKFDESNFEKLLADFLEDAEQYKAERNIKNIKQIMKNIRIMMKYGISIGSLSLDTINDIKEYEKHAKYIVKGDWAKTVWTKNKIDEVSRLIKLNSSSNIPKYVKEFWKQSSVQGTLLIDVSKIKDKKTRNKVSGIYRKLNK